MHALINGRKLQGQRIPPRFACLYSGVVMQEKNQISLCADHDLQQNDPSQTIPYFVACRGPRAVPSGLSCRASKWKNRQSGQRSGRNHNGAPIKSEQPDFVRFDKTGNTRVPHASFMRRAWTSGWRATELADTKGGLKRMDTKCAGVLTPSCTLWHSGIWPGRLLMRAGNRTVRLPARSGNRITCRKRRDRSETW